MGAQRYWDFHRIAVIEKESVELVAEVVRNHLEGKTNRPAYPGYREIYALKEVELEWRHETAAIKVTAIEYGLPTPEQPIAPSPELVSSHPIEIQVRPAQRDTVEVWLKRMFGNAFWSCERELKEELSERWPPPGRVILQGDDNEALGLSPFLPPQSSLEKSHPPARSQDSPSVEAALRGVRNETQAEPRKKRPRTVRKHRRAYRILDAMRTEELDSVSAKHGGRNPTYAEYRDRLKDEMNWAASDKTIRRILDEGDNDQLGSPPTRK